MTNSYLPRDLVNIICDYSKFSIYEIRYLDRRIKHIMWHDAANESVKFNPDDSDIDEDDIKYFGLEPVELVEVDMDGHMIEAKQTLGRKSYRYDEEGVRYIFMEALNELYAKSYEELISYVSNAYSVYVFWLNELRIDEVIKADITNYEEMIRKMILSNLI